MEKLLYGFTLFVSFGGALLSQVVESPVTSAVTIVLALIGLASLLAKLHYLRLHELSGIERLRDELRTAQTDLWETKSELRSIREKLRGS